MADSLLGETYVAATCPPSQCCLEMPRRECESTVGAYYLGAAPSQLKRDVEPDASRRSRHDGHFAVEGRERPVDLL